MEETKRVPRRPHSEEMKARVLAECMQKSASVAKVPMSYGLNANLVHKCRRAVQTVQTPQATQAATTRPAAIALPQGSTGGFVALAMPSQAAAGVAPQANIHIELRRGATTIAVTWPTAAAADCAAWMRELLR